MTVFFRRTLAFLSIFFFLHAVTPGSFFALSFLDGDSQTMSQNLNTVAEEEDEHSGLELSFIASGFGSLLCIHTATLVEIIEGSLFSTPLEIFVPPPRLVVV